MAESSCSWGQCRTRPGHHPSRKMHLHPATVKTKDEEIENDELMEIPQLAYAPPGAVDGLDVTVASFSTSKTTESCLRACSVLGAAGFLLPRDFQCQCHNDAAMPSPTGSLISAQSGSPASALPSRPLFPKGTTDAVAARTLGLPRCCAGGTLRAAPTSADEKVRFAGPAGHAAAVTLIFGDSQPMTDPER